MATVENIIVGTTPNETITGNGGNDVFVFTPNFGHDTITNFAPGTDAMQLDHTIFATAVAALTAAHDDGYGNVVITDAVHDLITLKNVSGSSTAPERLPHRMTERVRDSSPWSNNGGSKPTSYVLSRIYFVDIRKGFRNEVMTYLAALKAAATA